MSPPTFHSCGESTGFDVSGPRGDQERLGEARVELPDTARHVQRHREDQHAGSNAENEAERRAEPGGLDGEVRPASEGSQTAKNLEHGTCDQAMPSDSPTIAITKYIVPIGSIRTK